MKALSKLTIIIFVLILSVGVLSGCSNSTKDSKEEVLDSNSDKPTKVAIIVQPESENKKLYDSAVSISAEKKYQMEEVKSADTEIVIYELSSEQYDDKRVDEIFDKIKSDEKINVLVVSSAREGLYKNISDLKRDRKDILTISAQLPDDDKLLIDNVDLNFKSYDLGKAKRIVEMAKSLGSEKFFVFASEDEKNNKEYSVQLKEMEKISKGLNMPYELISIPNLSTDVEKRALVSNEIDRLVLENGKDINIYTFNENYDDILLSKLMKKHFFVAEFSQPNVAKKIMNELGLNYLTRFSEDYGWMNAQIVAQLNAYSLERRMGSVGADVDSFILRYAVELGTNIKGKDFDISKAYNSYFLEKVSNARCKLSSGFLNKYKGVGNFKLVTPDQVIY